MRAFRNATHDDGSGYCGYLQMLSRSDNYVKYVLSYLIDSLFWNNRIRQTTPRLVSALGSRAVARRDWRGR